MPMFFLQNRDSALQSRLSGEIKIKYFYLVEDASMFFSQNGALHISTFSSSQNGALQILKINQQTETFFSPLFVSS